MGLVSPIERDRIIDAVRAGLQPLADVLALWESGSRGFKRVDELSDIDLIAIVEDGFVEPVFDETRRALEKLGEIDIEHRLSHPTPHGHDQCFYRLREASEFCLVDLAVVQLGNHPEELLVRERHGEPGVLFDKRGLVRAAPFDRAASRQAMRARRERLRTNYALFGNGVGKELERGRVTDAVWYYQRFTLPTVIELARMLHCPDRHDFGMRYLGHDLPPQLMEQITGLMFVADGDDLAIKNDRAEQMIRQLFVDLDVR